MQLVCKYISRVLKPQDPRPTSCKKITENSIPTDKISKLTTTSLKSEVLKMLGLLGIVLGTLLFLYYAFKYFTERNSTYWCKQNVPSLQNDLTLLDLLRGKGSSVDFDKQYYKDIGDAKFGGAFEFGNPILFLKDLGLIKNILVKDFDHFIDRRSFTDSDLLNSKSLFFLYGQEWKDMRSFLSPTFTSGKIKRMFHYFETSSYKMMNYLTKFHEKTDGGYTVRMTDIANRFTLDVIGATAFGMEVDCLTTVDSLFHKNAMRASDFNLKRVIRFGLASNFPRVASFLKLQMLDSESSKFYLTLLRQAFKVRSSSSNEQRDDFLQLLIETQDSGKSVSGSSPASTTKKPQFQLTEEVAIQQAFLFFFAGFDTVAGLIAQTCYHLAAYPEVQEKLFQEVSEVMEATGGKVNYEDVSKLKYLDMIFSEVLRMYPVVTRIERKCVQDYKIPGSNVVIPKGMLVIIPAESIHRDEKFYPDPMRFDPERFREENKVCRNQYTYMPFGIGPRNCIGMRFALIESKVALAHLVCKFEIKTTPNTPIPIEIPKVIGFYRAPTNLELQLVPR